MSKPERIWLEDQERYGWIMPAAPWWKRLPVIRHVRGAMARARVERFAAGFGSVGIGLGRPNQFDLWICYGISAGKERAE